MKRKSVKQSLVYLLCIFMIVILVGCQSDSEPESEIVDEPAVSDVPVIVEDPPKPEEPDVVEAPLPEPEPDPLVLLIQDEETVVAILADVSGGTAEGKGYVRNKDGVLTHAVMANLPPLEDGTFYEGWLVKRGPLDFFSTGMMDQLAMESMVDGNYLLLYTEDTDRSEYLEVVITLETVDDQQPEKHILEGLAQ